MMILLAIFVSLFFVFSLVSARLGRSIFTGLIVFTIAGMIMSSALPSPQQAGLNAKGFLALAELRLGLLWRCR
jgi:hypothetical protein